MHQLLATNVRTQNRRTCLHWTGKMFDNLQLSITSLAFSFFEAQTVTFRSVSRKLLFRCLRMRFFLLLIPSFLPFLRETPSTSYVFADHYSTCPRLVDYWFHKNSSHQMRGSLGEREMFDFEYFQVLTSVSGTRTKYDKSIF